jgi:hypothetical protein
MPKAWKNLCGGVNFPKNFAISQKRPPCFAHAQPHSPIFAVFFAATIMKRLVSGQSQFFQYLGGAA